MSSLLRRIGLVALAGALVGCGSTQPYQGMNEAQIYDRAVQAYERSDYDEAIKALDRLFLSFAGFPQAAEARLLLGHAHFAKGDYLSAQAEYTRFLDRHPVHEDAPVASLGICRALAELSPIPQRDQTYTRDAQNVCRNVVIDYRNSPQAVEAAEIAERMRVKLAHKEYLNAEFYLKRQLYDSAIKYFEFVVQGYPDTEWAPRALLGIYQANMAIGYEDLADEARDRLLERYPDSPAARQVNVDGNGGG